MRAPANAQQRRQRGAPCGRRRPARARAGAAAALSRGLPGAQVRLDALRQELAAAQEVVVQLRRMVADAEAEARA